MSIDSLTLNSWSGPESSDVAWQRALEDGHVLYCPQLAFRLEAGEERFLDPALSDTRRKSIYIRADRPGLFGTEAGALDQAALAAMLTRFDRQAMGLLGRLFPSYAGRMRAMGTSFRPRATGVGEKALSWRKDDTRLHVDAFPSNPTQGIRILRVFSNIGDRPRVWRVGEPFGDMARHFLPRIKPPLAGSAALMQALGITKRRRTTYDHYMLHLHDAAKADLAYQRDCRQETFEFMPKSSWICFSDQVMHAAMAGQFMIEQTVHVPLEALAYPAQSPAAQLAKLLGRPVLDEGSRASA